jgi:hypothetical protein
MVYRDAGGHCLECGGDLRQVTMLGHRYHQCADCGSALVDRSTWGHMWSAITTGALLPVPTPRTTGRPVRGCPRCGRPMQRWIMIVPLDECADHGMWFDRAELSTALAAAAVSHEEWLRLFMDVLARMS